MNIIFGKPPRRRNTKFFLYVLSICILFTLVGSCEQVIEPDNADIVDQLNNIESFMLQKPDTIEVLLWQLDTTKLSVLEKARFYTISGLLHSNNGDFQKSLEKLEKAEIVFDKLKDEYHLHVNKLIRAFVFEQLNLNSIAASLYVECELYFQKKNLRKFQFFASLGILRMGKYLNINKKENINQIEESIFELKEPIYKGLMFAAVAYIEEDDSLSLICYQNAKNEFKNAKYWSRFFAIDLNLLFIKLKKDHTIKGQMYYEGFLSEHHHYEPTVKQRLKYEYGQAYLLALAGKNQKAVDITEKILKDAKRFNIPSIEIDCLQALSVLYRRLGYYEMANNMMENYGVLKEKMMSDLQKNQLLALGAHYRYSELDRERLSLKVQIQQIFIFSFLIISFFSLIFIVTWFKFRLNKKQKEILKLENVEIKDQIDKLLGSLEKAESKNENLLEQDKDMKIQYQESLDATELLSALQNRQIKTWMEYETIFTKLRPDWIKNLKKKFPQLTATDLKYCMCLYFNMNNYMISDLCDVSMDAVKSAKKRIRDKLLLKDSSEIYFFLKKFD